jgi:hypothetical protein
MDQAPVQIKASFVLGEIKFITALNPFLMLITIALKGDPFQLLIVAHNLVHEFKVGQQKTVH